MKYILYTTKATQNGIEFYQTTLTYGEIDTLSVVTGDSKADRILPHDTQYKLRDKSVREISQHLSHGSFCSALTFSLVPNSLKPLVLGADYTLEDSDIPKIERLTINVGFFLLAVDGRHRIAGIRKLLEENPEFADQKAPVVLIPFSSASDTERLFSDLSKSK